MNVEAMLPAIGIAVIRPLFVLAPLPLAGSKPLPGVVQVALALTLAIFVMPTVASAVPAIDPVALLLVAANEALTGLAIGLLLSMTIAGARGGGEVIGVAMGLGFASVLDPQHGTSVPTVGQFLSLTSVALFFSMGGPVVLLAMLRESYVAVPIGEFVGSGGLPTLNRAMDAMFHMALGIAAPVLVATLGVQLSLASIARLAPQLNLFALGFPATLIIGLVVLALSFPAIGLLMSEHWRAAFGETVAMLAAR